MKYFILNGLIFCLSISFTQPVWGETEAAKNVPAKKRSITCRTVLLTLAAASVTLFGFAEWNKQTSIANDLKESRKTFLTKVEESKPELNQYINRIADKLIDASGYQELRTGDLPLKVMAMRGMDSRQVAYLVGISEENIAVLDYEPELAALIAHELSHAILKHDADTLSIKHGHVWGNVRRIESLIAGAKDIFGGNGTVYEKHLSDSLQRHEFEADALSLKLLEKAGYPKEAAVSALLKIANHECAHQPMNTLNTNTFAHPSAERRLEQINDLLPTPIKIKYHRYKYYIESGKATIPGQSEWQKIERKP